MCPSTNAFLPASVVDVLGPFKAPKPAASRCTHEEITSIFSRLKAKSVKTLADLQAGLASECTSCLFSNAADQTWAPFIVFNEPPQVVLNAGACYAATTTTDCGRAVFYETLCVESACASCDPGKEAACYSDALHGSCKTTHAERETVCTKEQLLNAQGCEPTAPDAKLDFYERMHAQSDELCAKPQ